MQNLTAHHGMGKSLASAKCAAIKATHEAEAAAVAAQAAAAVARMAAAKAALMDEFVTKATTQRGEGKAMASYLVFRHGSNGANQPMTERMALGWFDGHTGEEACELARRQGETVYGNQRLTYKLASRCTKAEKREGDASTAWREDDIPSGGGLGAATRPHASSGGCGPATTPAAR